MPYVELVTVSNFTFPGEVQKEGLVIHVIARKVFDQTSMLLDLAGSVDIGEA